MRLEHKGTVPLTTERLVLRRVRLEDAGAMYANWAGDGQVTQYLTWETHAGVEDSRAYLRGLVAEYERPDFYEWGIEADGELAGAIGVPAAQIDERARACMVGYCLGRAWWGRGIMPEALRAVVDFLFGRVNFNRIAAKHDAENGKSGRVMAKAGMRREGALRQAEFCKGRLCDMVYYSILRGEWEAKQ